MLPPSPSKKWDFRIRTFLERLWPKVVGISLPFSKIAGLAAIYTTVTMRYGIWGPRSRISCDRGPRFYMFGMSIQRVVYGTKTDGLSERWQGTSNTASHRLLVSSVVPCRLLLLSDPMIHQRSVHVHRLIKTRSEICLFQIKFILHNFQWICIIYVSKKKILGICTWIFWEKNHSVHNCFKCQWPVFSIL